MIDEDHTPILGYEILVLMAVIVGDQVIKSPLQIECSIKGEDFIRRFFDFFRGYISEAYRILHVKLTGAPVPLKSFLHSGGYHV